jgi:hypothetical protein
MAWPMIGEIPPAAMGMAVGDGLLKPDGPLKNCVRPVKI